MYVIHTIYIISVLFIDLDPSLDVELNKTAKILDIRLIIFNMNDLFLSMSCFRAL